MSWLALPALIHDGATAGAGLAVPFGGSASIASSTSAQANVPTSQWTTSMITVIT